MSGALCIGQHALFDSTDPRDHYAAAELCDACPLIEACRDHLQQVAATAGYYGHPEGTWAGLLIVPGDGVRRLSAYRREHRLGRAS